MRKKKNSINANKAWNFDDYNGNFKHLIPNKHLTAHVRVQWTYPNSDVHVYADRTMTSFASKFANIVSRLSFKVSSIFFAKHISNIYSLIKYLIAFNWIQNNFSCS